MANSCSISCSRYFRITKQTGRSLCQNGLAHPVLMVCTTTEVRPNSVGDAANELRFLSITSTSSLRTCFGIGRVYTRSSVSTFCSFPAWGLHCPYLNLTSTVSGWGFVTSGSCSFFFCSGASLSIIVVTKFVPILRRFCDVVWCDRQTSAELRLPHPDVFKSGHSVDSIRFQTPRFYDCFSNRVVNINGSTAHPHRLVPRVVNLVQLQTRARVVSYLKWLLEL